MFPDLIDIGFLRLRTYGACMAVGFLLCWKLVERLSGRKDLSNLLVSLMLSGVVGSRVAYVIEHWSEEFSSRPLDAFAVWNGGLMFYGGLMLSLVSFVVWCVVKKERVFGLADLLATVVPLGHAFGRIGCFFYGCCYGRASESACAVCFPRFSPAWHEQLRDGLIQPSAVCSLPVLPTQLFEAAALLALFALLFFRYRRTVLSAAPTPSFNLSCYLMGYAVVRFGMECLRGDPRAAVGPFSISQTISIGMFVCGLVVLVVRRRFSGERV